MRRNVCFPFRVGMFFPYNLSPKIQYLPDKGSKQKQELFVGQGWIHDLGQVRLKISSVLLSRKVKSDCGSSRVHRKATWSPVFTQKYNILQFENILQFAHNHIILFAEAQYKFLLLQEFEEKGEGMASEWLTLNIGCKLTTLLSWKRQFSMVGESSIWFLLKIRC